MSHRDRLIEFTSEAAPHKRWRLKRLRVLGKGSFGLATLVENVAAADGGGGGGGGGAPPAPPELLVVKEVNLGCCKASERDSLFQEIRILKKVRHPNIVQFIDSFLDAGENMLYILMEYCDGGDLAELHERAMRRAPTRGLTEDEVWSVFIQLLMALRYLHFEHRILHRDLKPQNVFLTKAMVVKVGDFGVSTILSQSVDFAKTFCGSPYYLAPELCMEEPYNGKADLWSLGCILYELAAHGERPFKGRTLVSIIQNVIAAKFVPLDDLVADPPSPRALLKHGPPQFAGHGAELRRTVALLLKKLPDERASISRLLRLPTVRHRAVRGMLPPPLAAAAEYAAQFGWLPLASPMSSSAPATSPAASSVMSRQTSATLADGDEMSRTQLTIAMTSGAASVATRAPLAATLGADDDGSTLYDDDEFEEFDDDDEAEALERKVYAAWLEESHTAAPAGM
jgi:serine/threonine protein kinase